MATLKEYSVGAIIGMTLAAMIKLGIFATKADLSDLRAEMAVNYATKAEISPVINEMRQDIRKILVRLGGKDGE